MNMSVKLFHTTWTDGKSIKKHWITGITNLEWQDQEVTSEENPLESTISETCFKLDRCEKVPERP